MYIYNVNKSVTIKMMLLLFFLTYFKFNNTAQTQNTVVFSPDWSQNSELKNSNDLNSISGCLTVYGWSRDGKVLFQSNSTFDSWLQIIDLVVDTILCEAPIFNNEEISEVFRLAKSKYKIEPYVGNIGSFPYSPSSQEKFNIDISKELDYGNNYNLKLTVKKTNQNTFRTSGKMIGSFYYRIDDWIDKEIKFFYVKSPYENRVLVVAAAPQLHIEFDYLFYSFHVFGCHLSAGFK